MTLYMALLTQLLMFAVFTLCLVMYYDWWNHLYWIEYVNTVLFVASISVIYWSSRYVFEYNRMVYYVALGETSINCCPKRPSQRALRQRCNAILYFKLLDTFCYLLYYHVSILDVNMNALTTLSSCMKKK
eukprot:154500_1